MPKPGGKASDFFVKDLSSSSYVAHTVSSNYREVTERIVVTFFSIQLGQMGNVTLLARMCSH